MKQPYNTIYHPAMPTLMVRLYSPVTDKLIGPFSAIIDTGSDATLVPLAYLQMIGAEETAPGWMIGITGDRQPVTLYFIDVYVNNLAYLGIRVIADKNAEEIILGRDVLNKLPLFLDGVQQQTMLVAENEVKRLRSR